MSMIKYLEMNRLSSLDIFSVMGMRDSEMLCEFIHTIIGQRKLQETHECRCRSKSNNLLYQSGSF